MTVADGANATMASWWPGSTAKDADGSRRRARHGYGEAHRTDERRHPAPAPTRRRWPRDEREQAVTDPPTCSMAPAVQPPRQTGGGLGVVHRPSVVLSHPLQFADLPVDL